MTSTGKACLLAALFTLAAGSAGADLIDTIETSASGSLDGDLYSYLFTISETSDPLVYDAVLTNTSPPGSDSKIDLLAFNMDAVLGTDFTIESVVPDWTFGSSGGGVQFDYVGSADPPGSTNKLGSGDSLTFSFHFVSGFVPTFDLWTATASSLGTGIGGGEDSGQVAVSFQTLGDGGEGSDLLASTWQTTVTETTEPGTLVLMGTGLLGIATILRRRKS